MFREQSLVKRHVLKGRDEMADQELPLKKFLLMMDLWT
jgi:hypothetical protein